MKHFLLAFIAVNFLFTLAHAGEMTIASEEWPPYSYTENGRMTGYCTDIIASVLARMGIRPRFESYPWARAEKLALGGQMDALFSASYKEKRAAACHYPSEKLFDSEYVLFIRKDDKPGFKFDGFEDLKGKAIGVTRAYSYTPEFWEFLKANKNYDEAPTDQLNMSLLAKGRIDVFPAEKGNGLTLIRQMGLQDKLSFIDTPIIQKPYFIIFNKQRVTRALVDAFDKELKAFKNEPEYAEIRSRYLE